MNENRTTPGPIVAQLTLAWPETLIQQIADVAERLSADDRSSTRSPWCDVAGTAAYLNMTPDAVRKAAQRRLLPGHQPFGPGSRYFFHRRELDDFIAGKNGDDPDSVAGRAG